METFATAVLFLTALALPVGLFLLLRPRSRLQRLLAAALAVGAGWAFNVACIVATQAITVTRAGSQVKDDSLALVTSYGWVCPLVLVLLTWLVWHFATRKGSAR